MEVLVNCKDLKKKHLFVLVGVCCFDCNEFIDVKMTSSTVSELKEFLKMRHDDFLEYYYVYYVNSYFDLRKVVGLYE